MKLLERVAQELNIPIEFRTNGINHSSNYMFERIPKLPGIKRYAIDESLYCYVVEKPTKKLYMRAAEDEVLREAFGIVFSDAGIRARPMPMFSNIPSAYIFRETRLDVEGQNVCGMVVNEQMTFVARNGRIVEQAPEGAGELLKHCGTYGLTPQFTIVSNRELGGAIMEVPGWHLTGIRSILTGRILPMKYLAEIAGEFGLQPIILFDQDRAGFINNSHHKGLIDLFITNEGEQFLSRELTEHYREVLPIVNFLRYGREVHRYLQNLESNPADPGCLLTPDEWRVYEKTRDIMEEMDTKNYESLKNRVKKMRRIVIKKRK